MYIGFQKKNILTAFSIPQPTSTVKNYFDSTSFFIIN